MALETWAKDKMWQKISGEILKRFFVTVEIYRRPGWNIFRNLRNGVWNKNVPGENFLKINKQGGGGVGGRLLSSIRDLRVQ